MTPSITICTATMDDSESIAELMRSSAHTLAAADYGLETVDSAFHSGAWGLDTQLIRDETYYLAFVGRNLAGCGGWSYRRTLFGTDNGHARDDDRLVPDSDAAIIRAFFVHPDFARRGLGAMLLHCCETAAQLAGYRAFELAATLTGEHLYRANGYAPIRPIEYELGDGLSMRGVLMRKQRGDCRSPISTAIQRNSTVRTTLGQTAAS